MSACGNCGGGVCTCAFEDSSNAEALGIGAVYAPANFRPTNVPKPRPYGYMSRQLSDQTIPANLTTPIVFDSVAETPFAGGMIGTAPYNEFKVPANGAGVYLVYGFANFNSLNVVLSIRKNGIDLLASQASPDDAIVLLSGGSRSLMTLVELDASDRLELVAVNGTGSASLIRFDITTFFTTFAIFWAQWMRA